MNKKLFSSAFLTAILIIGLILVGTAHFSTVNASTDVAGMISSDATWIKANSPCTLTGAVGISSGSL